MCGDGGLIACVERKCLARKCEVYTASHAHVFFPQFYEMAFERDGRRRSRLPIRMIDELWTFALFACHVQYAHKGYRDLSMSKVSDYLFYVAAGCTRIFPTTGQQIHQMQSRR